MALLLSACSNLSDNRGHVHQTDAFSQIKPGVTTREEVRTLLGSPSSTGTFGEESWYYITSKKERKAFLEPVITERQVTRVTFNQEAVVTAVEQFDKEAGRDITVVEKSTPTEGHTLGFVEQILGNVGRFNKPREAGRTAGSPSGPGRP